MGLAGLPNKGQDKPLNVSKKLRRTDIIDMVLDDRYHLSHHPFDLLI